MYGGVEPHIYLPKDNFVQFPDVALQRRRFNSSAIAQAILMPWLLFVGTAWLLSSEVHYYHAEQCWFLITLGVLVVVAFLSKGLLARRRMLLVAKDDYALQQAHDPTWLVFIALTSFIALVLGVLIGQYNYDTNTKTYHSMTDLNTVTNVSPAYVGGKAYMDASMLVFTKGTYVDKNKALGFKDSDTYCVAPITIGEVPLAIYDYWAVGVNCCNPFGGDFWCGAMGSPTANTGLRLMDDTKRAFYRLAVQQASAEYSLQEPQHALFFTWAEDPRSIEQTSPAEKYRAIVFGSAFVHLVCQTLAVLFVVAHYQKFLE